MDQIIISIINEIWWYKTSKLDIYKIIKHSKASQSSIQLALFYLIKTRFLIKNIKNNDLAICGHRMFLGSLILAFKYLYDKNYKNKELEYNSCN